MSEDGHRAARLMAVAGATCISLACGTNYAYSAWAPQFAQRLQLSSTQSNIIGTMGNMGMYITGIPVGLLVDGRGPRPSILIGGVCVGLGYFPLKAAYDAGAGGVPFILLCLFSFLTGTGSCFAFSASIKVAALNWPQHRGTATGIPLAAFGLSALFFTTVAGIIFPHSTSKFLLLLSLGTVILIFGSFPFIRVPQATSYTALTTFEPGSSRPRKDSTALHRPKHGSHLDGEVASKQPSSVPSSPAGAGVVALDRAPDVDQGSSESSSLLSAPGDIDEEEDDAKQKQENLHGLDVSGLGLLKHVEFYQLFLLLGTLTGVGLMTINNIGNDAQALWKHHDPNVTKEFIVKRQLIHVSTISCASFLGRLASGIGSDHLVKRLELSRFWCLTASSSIFIVAQVLATQIGHPSYLFVLSTLTGLAYGALFGVYPALVADAFGVSGLSLNWGYMILSPVVFGNLFNIQYGAIYDSHSTVSPDGVRECSEGLDCYRTAYWITFAGAVTGLLLSIWCIRHERLVKSRRLAGRPDGHHQA